MNTSRPMHRPPRIYVDDTWYIITASTIGKVPSLSTKAHLELWREKLRALVTEFGIELRAWVVLPHHCHLLLKPRLGRDIGKFMGRLNGGTAHDLNQLDQTPGRQVWYAYWDTCIRGEEDHWTRFNYIHHNPVKHKLVKYPGDWEFSSYNYCLRTKGAEWLADCLARYPVVDYSDDDF